MPAEPPVLDPLSAVLVEVYRRAAEAATAEGLDPVSAATLIGVSVRKFHEMNSSGLIPAPVELGDRCPRWLKSELLAWMRHGAPSRARWVLMRNDVLPRRGG